MRIRPRKKQNKWAKYSVNRSEKTGHWQEEDGIKITLHSTQEKPKCPLHARK